MNVLKVIAPAVRIPEPVWKKLMAYVEACPMEVGGLGMVEMIGGALVVTDVYCVEQDVTPATTTLDPEAMTRFLMKWIADGKDPSLLKLWWHSHADMGVFWSGKDLDTIERLSRRGFFLAIVGNRRRETKTRLALGSPLRLALDDLPLEVMPEFDEALRKAADDEVKAKVRMKRPFFGRKKRPAAAEEAGMFGAFDISTPPSDDDGTEGDDS